MSLKQRRYLASARWRSVVPPLVLVVIAILATFHSLRQWHGPAYTLTNELYVPSVMMALGQGFLDPPVDEVPGLRDFLYLNHGHQRYAPAALPDRFSETELSIYQRYHRYLVWSMGVVWRVLGVSWDSAKWLAAGLHVAAALAVYGLFRLALGRWLALAGAALFSTGAPLLAYLYDIRDYSKVPFLLGGLCLMALLITRSLPLRRRLLLALLLGVTLGIGTGFRRDVMVAMPPAFFCVAMASCDPGRKGWAERGAMAGVLSGAFLLSAWPVLASFQEQGSAFHHDTVMGMATVLENELSLRPASYEKVPVKHDFFISALANTLARAEAKYGTTEYDNFFGLREHDERPMLLYRMWWSYPADTVLRGIAATVAALRGVSPATANWNSPWEAHLRWAGPVYALAALWVAIRTLGYRKSLALAAVAGYFGAITSLQYEPRHALHLYAIPIGCALVAFQAAWQDWRGKSRILVPPMHALAAAVGVCLAPFTLWLLVLPWQIVHVRGMESALQHAPLQELAFEVESADNWDWLRPIQPLNPALADPPGDVLGFFRPLYLMCEFRAPAGGLPLAVRYEAVSPMGDYSMVMAAGHEVSSEGTVVRFYFPAPEFVGEGHDLRLRAVGLPEGMGQRVSRLCLVNQSEPIGTQPAISVIEGHITRKWQTLNLTYRPPVLPALPGTSAPAWP